jgi:hypothetical protein
MSLPPLQIRQQPQQYPYINAAAAARAARQQQQQPYLQYAQPAPPAPAPPAPAPTPAPVAANKYALVFATGDVNLGVKKAIKKAANKAKGKKAAKAKRLENLEKFGDACAEKLAEGYTVVGGPVMDNGKIIQAFMCGPRCPATRGGRRNSKRMTRKN